MEGNDWIPPSPEGLTHPAELENAFSRTANALKFAFETRNQEMFDQAMLTLFTVFARVTLIALGFKSLTLQPRPSVQVYYFDRR